MHLSMLCSGVGGRAWCGVYIDRYKSLRKLNFLNVDVNILQILWRETENLKI